MQLECVLKCLGFLRVGVHIKKDAAAQELQSGFVIVVITLNCILFSLFLTIMFCQLSFLFLWLYVFSHFPQDECLLCETLDKLNFVL